MRSAHIVTGVIVQTYTAEAIQKNSKIKGVVGLVAEIRDRFEKGHYDFMTWEGRTKLREKLNEYENYAREPTSRAAASSDIQKQKLKAMEVELRALLGSTY